MPTRNPSAGSLRSNVACPRGETNRLSRKTPRTVRAAMTGAVPAPLYGCARPGSFGDGPGGADQSGERMSSSFSRNSTPSPVFIRWPSSRTRGRPAAAQAASGVWPSRRCRTARCSRRLKFRLASWNSSKASKAIGATTRPIFAISTAKSRISSWAWGSKRSDRKWNRLWRFAFQYHWV